MPVEVQVALVTGLFAFLVAAYPLWRNGKTARSMASTVGVKNGKGSLVEMLERLDDRTERIEQHIVEDRRSISKIDDRLIRMERRYPVD